MSGQKAQYDGPPSTFVNAKRVKEGEDSKGRRTTQMTFGLKNNRDGVEVNTADDLRNALNALEGKQVNITFHVEDVDAGNGRTFAGGFARVTEMIPKDQQQGRTAFVPKQSAAAATKAKTDSIRQKFGG